MKDYTVEKKRFKDKIYGYITLKLKAYEYRRGWFKLDCPFCSGEGKMGIHLRKDIVHCFKCGYAKNPISFLLELENLHKFSDLRKVLDDFNSSSYNEPKFVPIPKTDVRLPESFKLLIMGKGKYATMARNYMKRRGFNILELTRKGVGYCDDGRYKGYIIFPCYGVGGELVYFQTRRFFGNGPKFNNPTLEEIGVGKSQMIYNIQALQKYNRVYVVESIINALTLGDEAVALYGKYASNYQLFVLLSSPANEYILILDPDARKESISLALTLVKSKGIKLVELPEGQDVNSFGLIPTMEIVNRSKWLTYNDILKFKLNGKNNFN